MLLKAPGLDHFLTDTDHGIQLCMGTQILLGKIPSIDFVNAYGPMAMYTSALGLRLSGSLIGETLLCVLGHALCLFLLYWLVRQHSTRSLGLAAAAAGFFLQARYYKWYVWLIPLGTLWALHHYVNSTNSSRQRWVVVTGMVLGLSWLYRLDMGTLGFAATFVFLAVVESGCSLRRLPACWRILTLFSASFACVLAGWFAYLMIAVGIRAPLVFLQTTLDGALMISRGMALPLPVGRIFLVVYMLAPVFSGWPSRSGWPTNGPGEQSLVRGFCWRQV